jgi:hypothetical protein
VEHAQEGQPAFHFYIFSRLFVRIAVDIQKTVMLASSRNLNPTASEKQKGVRDMQLAVGM